MVDKKYVGYTIQDFVDGLNELRKMGFEVYETDNMSLYIERVMGDNHELHKVAYIDYPENKWIVVNSVA